MSPDLQQIQPQWVDKAGHNIIWRRLTFLGEWVSIILQLEHTRPYYQYVTAHRSVYLANAGRTSYASSSAGMTPYLHGPVMLLCLCSCNQPSL